MPAQLCVEREGHLADAELGSPIRDEVVQLHRPTIASRACVPPCVPAIAGGASAGKVGGGGGALAGRVKGGGSWWRAVGGHLGCGGSGGGSEGGGGSAGDGSGSGGTLQRCRGACGRLWGGGGRFLKSLIGSPFWDRTEARADGDRPPRVVERGRAGVIPVYSGDEGCGEEVRVGVKGIRPWVGRAELVVVGHGGSAEVVGGGGVGWREREREQERAAVDGNGPGVPPLQADGGAEVDGEGGGGAGGGEAVPEGAWRVEVGGV
jgi:hypothetical protein